MYAYLPNFQVKELRLYESNLDTKRNSRLVPIKAVGARDAAQLAPPMRQEHVTEGFPGV
jgi:hypothetical protein